MTNQPIALQLYSLRDLAKKDFLAVLELSAGLGYDGVEFAGYGGLEAAVLRDHLQRLELQPVSSHVALQRLEDDLDAELAYNRLLGNDTLVCPAPPAGFEQNAENWRRLGQRLTEVGKKLNDQGFQFGYHNHSFEFVSYEGVYGLDILLAAADPRYVFAQLDLGWVLHGGEDPLAYLKKYQGRCPLVHIKDFDEQNSQTDVGCGVLDLAAVKQQAREAGVEWLILETEVYAISPEHSVRTGLANLLAAP